MLELRFGSKVVRDMMDEQRRGQVDPERLEEVLNEATDICAGLCLPGFTLDQLRDLAAVDYHVRGLCCDIAIGIAARARPGLLDASGKNPYLNLQDRAEKRLQAIVQARAARFAGEEQVSVNRKLGCEVNRPSALPVFAGTTNDPVGPGGF
jgi:phage gp36-like protein